MKIHARHVRFLNHGGGMLGRLTLFDMDMHSKSTVVGEFMTLEREWKGNETAVSCIPEGRFEAFRYNSPTYGQVIALQGNGVTIDQRQDVRWGILIHPANWPNELDGCIAVGKAVTVRPDGVKLEPSSTQALADLLRIVGSNPFPYTITRTHW